MMESRNKMKMKSSWKLNILKKTSMFFNFSELALKKTTCWSNLLFNLVTTHACMSEDFVQTCAGITSQQPVVVLSLR